MPMSILALFVIVIDRTRAGSRTRADERAFPAANQRACTCADSRADADAFSRLLFSSLRVMTIPALAASDGNCDREREHQQQN